MADYSTEAIHARNAGSKACSLCGEPPELHVERDEDGISVVHPVVYEPVDEPEE